MTPADRGGFRSARRAIRDYCDRIRRHPTTTDATPDHILQIGFGFWASKTLLSAVELGLYTHLGSGPKAGPELERAMGLSPRATYDFLDTLVALGLLARDGDGPAAKYSNTPDTAVFLDRKSPQHIGGILEIGPTPGYIASGPISRPRSRPASHRTRERRRRRLRGTLRRPRAPRAVHGCDSGISLGNFATFAQTFDFSKYKTMADIGGATGQLALFVARSTSPARSSPNGERKRASPALRSDRPGKRGLAYK